MKKENELPEGCLGYIKGITGQLFLYEDHIVISHKGAMAMMATGLTKGEKSISISEITSVQMKPGTMVMNGYLQFSYAGSNDGTAGIMEATRDENSVVFQKKNNDEAKKILDYINAHKNKDFSFIPQQVKSSADEIKEFKELLDSGAITQEEYDAKKKQLLGL